MDKLEASLRWAEQNRIDGAKTGGWRSNYLPFGSGPEAWFSAAVLIAVWKMRNIVSHHLNDKILTEFGAKRFKLIDDSSLAENRFYDCEIPLTSPGKSTKLLGKRVTYSPHCACSNRQSSCSMRWKNSFENATRRIYPRAVCSPPPC